MGNAITQESRALWLMMARSGGWWTVKLLVRQWWPTFAPYEVQDILDGLLPARYVAVREDVPGEFSYCVTSECVPLPGFDLAGKELQGAA